MLSHIPIRGPPVRSASQRLNRVAAGRRMIRSRTIPIIPQCKNGFTVSYDSTRRGYRSSALNDLSRDGGVPIGAHEGESIDFLRRHERECSGCDLLSRNERYRVARSCGDRISDTRMLMAAAQHLMRNGDKAAGPNGQRLSRLYRTNRKQVWKELRRLSKEVETGTYRPGPVRKIDIPKSSGKGTRPIEVAEWQDQAVQRAIVQFVQPLIDPLFDDLSVGFRPGRDRCEAVARVVHLMHKTGRYVLVSADLRDAFTKVPHAPLLERVQALLGQERLTRLIGRIVGGNGRKRGIPQGGAPSPLLLNIYLDGVLDQRWKKRHPDIPLIRYADDILLLCHNVEEAQQAYETLTELLKPTGTQTKGTYETDTSDLRTGPRAEWLGYSLGLEGGEITVRVGGKFPIKLRHHLATALAEADGALVTQQVIKGVVDQLGPCYQYEDHLRVLRHIEAIARELGMGETPSDDESLGAWQRSHARYVTVQRHLQVADMAHEMVTTATGHGSARGHRESATTSRANVDDTSRLFHESLGGATETPSVMIVTGVCLPSGIGGWAFQLSEGDTRRYRIESGVTTNATANRLALQALIRGLEQLADERRLALRPVEIFTESHYLAEGVGRLFPASDSRRWYRSGDLPLTNEDLWREVATRLEAFNFNIRCLRGWSAPRRVGQSLQPVAVPENRQAASSDGTKLRRPQKGGTTARQSRWRA